MLTYFIASRTRMLSSWIGNLSILVEALIMDLRTIVIMHM